MVSKVGGMGTPVLSRTCFDRAREGNWPRALFFQCGGSADFCLEWLVWFQSPSDI